MIQSLNGKFFVMRYNGDEFYSPLVIYNSVENNPNRLANIKTFTQFQKELDANNLPPWMFITPNMTDDGHDTDVTFAGSWSSRFLTPLLSNPKFMNHTLVLLTFDENETYQKANKVWALLLGDAVPSQLKGTTDSTYYSHCTFHVPRPLPSLPSKRTRLTKDPIDSEIATVEANWNLHTLGRWDVGANVYSFVGKQTGDSIRDNPSPYYYHSSYPGIENSKHFAPQPVPNAKLVHNGRTVLPAIQDAWKDQQSQTYYTDSVVTPDGAHLPVYLK